MLSGREKGGGLALAILVIAVIVLGYLLYKCKHPSTAKFTSPDSSYWLPVTNLSPKKPPKGMIKRFVKAAQLGNCAGRVRAIAHFIGKPVQRRMRGFDASPQVQSLIAQTDLAFSSLSSAVNDLVKDVDTISSYLNDTANLGSWTVSALNNLTVTTAKGKRLVTGISAMITDFESKKGQASATGAQVEALYLWLESLGSADVWQIGYDTNAAGAAIYKNIDEKLLQNPNLSEAQKERVFAAFNRMYHAMAKTVDGTSEPPSPWGQNVGQKAGTLANMIADSISRHRMAWITADIASSLSNGYTTPINSSDAASKYVYAGPNNTSNNYGNNLDLIQSITAYNHLWSRLKKLEYLVGTVLEAPLDTFGYISPLTPADVQSPETNAMYTKAQNYAAVLKERLNQLTSQLGSSLNFPPVDYSSLQQGWQDGTKSAVTSALSGYLGPWRDALGKYGAILRDSDIAYIQGFVPPTGPILDPKSYASNYAQLLSVLKAFSATAKELGVAYAEGPNTRAAIADIADITGDVEVSLYGAVLGLKDQLLAAQNDRNALTAGMTRTMTSMNSLADKVMGTTPIVADGNTDIQVTDGGTVNVTEAGFEAVPPALAAAADNMAPLAEQAMDKDIEAERLGLLISSISSAISAASEGSPVIDAVFGYHAGLVRQLRDLEAKNESLMMELASIQAEISARLSEEETAISIMQGAASAERSPEASSALVMMAADLRGKYDQAVADLSRARAEYQNLAQEVLG